MSCWAKNQAAATQPVHSQWSKGRINLACLDAATPEIKAWIDPACAGLQLSKIIANGCSHHRTRISLLHPNLHAIQLIPLRQADIGVEQPNPTAMTLMLQMLKGSVATRSKASTFLTLEQAQRHLPENLLQWNWIEGR